MEDWTGFTDEELNKLKRQTSNPGGGGLRQIRNGPTVRGPPSGRFRTPPRESNPRNVQARRPPGSQSQVPLDRQQMLSPPAEKSKNVASSNAASQGQVKSNSSKSVEKKEVEVHPKEEVKPDPPPEVKEVDQKEFMQKQLSSVEAFQMQQKLMEEQNKKKKQLLYSAITQRQARAKTEAVKLGRIQRELSQLDQLLSADVCIIRDRIEEASREYLEAQKRYERAEREFIESKLDLHSKNELKDSLTEHLYTIIHQNEVRKAKKLTELMEKLDMEGDGELEEPLVELSTPPAMTPQALLLGQDHRLPSHSHHGSMQPGTQTGPITSPPAASLGLPLPLPSPSPTSPASPPCTASHPPAATVDPIESMSSTNNGPLPPAVNEALPSTPVSTGAAESHTNATSDGDVQQKAENSRSAPQDNVSTPAKVDANCNETPTSEPVS